MTQNDCIPAVPLSVPFAITEFPDRERKHRADVRVLLMASNGRDAHRVIEALSTSEISVIICTDTNVLLARLNEGAGTAIVGQEALSPPAQARIVEWLRRQPRWSDLPFIILGSSRNPNDALMQNVHGIELLGNMTLLERPLRSETIRSCVRLALRARQQQYLARRDLESLSLAIKDLEQFAYSASHDLREPLRTVAIYSELIAERYSLVLDDTGRTFLGYLKSSAGHMQMLVRDLLAYTQATGVDEESPEPVNAAEQLGIVLASLRTAIDRSRAIVTFDELPLVRMKAVQLQQLFRQLIANAIKYQSSPESPARDRWTRVHISAVPDQDIWRFSVSDNGIGIEPRFQDQIFGIFKRLHAYDQFEGSGLGPGTGIGLAICRKIVERNGGRIWVESGLGEGSTFYFTVPAV